MHHFYDNDNCYDDIMMWNNFSIAGPLWREGPAMQHFDVSFINLNMLLTHWGRVTHICVSKLSILGLDNGLSPGRRQAII